MSREREIRDKEDLTCTELGIRLRSAEPERIVK